MVTCVSAILWRMDAEQLKRVKEILSTIKKQYLAARERGGLGRNAWEAKEEVDETCFLDFELAAAFSMLLRKELATELGIESWVRQDDLD